MKPAEQMVYLLGVLTGEVRALRSSIESSSSAQATVNTEFSLKIEKAAEAAAEAKNQVELLRTQIPVKTPWWAVVGGVGGILAATVAGVTVLNLLLK